MSKSPIKSLIRAHALLGGDTIPFDEIEEAIEKYNHRAEVARTCKRVTHRFSGKVFILPLVSPYNAKAK